MMRVFGKFSAGNTRKKWPLSTAVRVAIGLAIAGILPLASAPTPAVNLILDQDGIPDTRLRALVNSTQTSITEVISGACPSQANEREFQTRCNNFIGFANARRNANDSILWRAGYASALQQVSPEQFIGQGTVATRSSANIIGSRLAALRMGVRGFNLAGFNIDGMPATNSLANQLAKSVSGGAAGDDVSDAIWNKLGVFFNGIGTFGDVDTTRNQVGFDFRSAGATTGADYRFSESLIVGAAFTYLRMESDFDRDQGSLNSHAYSGSLYGTYYLPNGFYVDGLGTVGGLDYDSTRVIDYTLRDPATGRLFDDVNARATSNPGGMQYVASVGVGYNQALNGLNINPYLRGNYNRLDIDAFNEQGGAGMAVGYTDQTVESVSSVLGAQLSYALSTASGVFTPYIHGEWRHEFEDNSRIISVRFLGNTTTTQAIGVVTDNPDRNYFNVGVGVSGTFARGVSAFFNYDTLLGYNSIESHAMMLGTRVEF